MMSGSFLCLWKVCEEKRWKIVEGKWWKFVEQWKTWWRPKETELSTRKWRTLESCQTLREEDHPHRSPCRLLG